METIGQMFEHALRLMGTGVLTVFVVLALFFGLIKLLIRFFPEKNEEKK